MDKITLLAIAVLSLIVIVALFRYRRGVRARISGPLGTQLELDASDDSGRGVHIEDAKSKKGRILAQDGSGQGTTVKRVEAQNDIIATSSLPEEKRRPKN